MAEGRPAFQRTQLAFAAAVRGNAESVLPGEVTPERMELYRELVFGNLESFIADGFPVLRAVLEPLRWDSLIRDFVRRHRSTTPYFSGIPAEFLAFLRDERGSQPDDPPFLLELAHYEWVELALSVAAEEPPAEHAAWVTDPLHHRIVLSPVAWPLIYRYPVHRIGPDHRPGTPPEQPSCLIVYRGRDDRVRFLEINPATYRLLDVVQTDPGRPAADYLARLARELGHGDAQPLLDYGAKLLRKLAERGVIGVPPPGTALRSPAPLGGLGRAEPMREPR